MPERVKHNDDRLLSKLFFRLLPVQVLIFAMSSINTLVDGLVAARSIDAASVGVVGLYFTMCRILEATGAVLLGGTAVLCGRYMGRGRLDKTDGMFSMVLTTAFICGAALTLASYVMPGTLAELLGASEELKPATEIYITGYAAGIIPQLLGQLLAYFLQLERQSTRSYVGIAAMITVNVGLDVLLVTVLGMGLRGLALATAASNWAYFLVLVPYYISGKSQIRFKLKSADWSELMPVIKVGFPGALLTFCLAARTLVLNRVLLTYAGPDGLSANAAYNMIGGLFMAISLGAGAVMRILASVFYGEEDIDSLKGLFRIVYSRLMAITVVLAAAVFVCSPLLSALYFPDRDSQVFMMTRELYMFTAISLPLILVCITNTNYLQAMGYGKFVNFVSFMDGFLAMTAPAVLLAPVMGARGVWLSIFIGVLITASLTPLYAIIKCGRIPRTAEEWMLIPPGFGVDKDNRLAITMRTSGEVARTAERVQQFCASHNISSRISYHAALCLEEMAGNVVEHGFGKDNKKHIVDTRVILKNDNILLRIKDDCIPFDPHERAVIADPEDPAKNIGIRMVYKIAEEVSYHNLLGLNVLTIQIPEERS